ncbi:maleylpyruvate isomerase family mycothiol-dependent enzyme [Streptomyces sp. DSM 3412]|uniref:Maleylpyruvate isomerase family mycothiol-dependent enzyme n=1 Tax=Streptomyces gottesmaniae TaxID=3075518 RepID=A0ABU2YPR2_9ACTN|nr:maleylpyruvate isomerase family mycothiol-dependent enzyme [Streptomyces sp. DSM 3412]MDT0566322.1 maleylpyruvate isomerase family mycothiol-dependent enzyme [Streptomyces sp. DSM 3412]
MSPWANGVSDVSWLGDPIDARALFGPELRSLLDTLRDLAPSDWSRPAAGRWTVHDVAAHLLGDYYGRLGHSYRNGFAEGETIEAFIHRTNQEWVELHADDSSASLIDALAAAGNQLAQRFATADLDAAALGVSWAGVDPAPAWLDIAREFTELWTHRQQIRHAIGRDTDPEPRALTMVLDTFLRALPHTLRHTSAPLGAQVQVIAEGPTGGSWTATATAERWSLAEAASSRPTAAVLLDTEIVWRLCTRNIDPADALARAHVQGDRRLAEAACQIVSIIY